MKFGHRCGNDGLSGAQLVGQLLRAGAAGDERSGAMAQFDHPFVFELAIDLGDRVWIDDQLLGQRPDAGQLLARAQRAGFDGVLHLLHQLEVDGDAGGRIRAEQHVSLCY